MIGPRSAPVAVTLGAPLLLAALGSGCALSGLDAAASFACKAPEGVQCESMSGVYANVVQSNLPGQRRESPPPLLHTPSSSSSAPSASTMTTGNALPGSASAPQPPATRAMPLRSPPTVLRVWIAPWEDSDGDLHDQSYIYLAIDGGRWLIEHNRRRIQETYRAVRAPAQATSGQPPVGKVPAPPSPPIQAGNLPASAREALDGLIRPGGGAPAEPSFD